MNTTAIIVEVLIVGMQASIWVMLLVLAVLGYEWIETAAIMLKGWEGLLSVLFLGFCYTLGTVVDRVADCLFVVYNPANILMRSEWIRRHAKVGHSDARMTVLCEERRATDFLSSVRSRVRITRATSVNVPLITLSLLLFQTTLTKASSWKVLVITAIIGLFIEVITLLAFTVLEVTYQKRLEQADRWLADRSNIRE